jgi:hypothetical protein
MALWGKTRHGHNQQTTLAAQGTQSQTTTPGAQAAHLAAGKLCTPKLLQLVKPVAGFARLLHARVDDLRQRASRDEDEEQRRKDGANISRVVKVLPDLHSGANSVRRIVVGHQDAAAKEEGDAWLWMSYCENNPLQPAKTSPAVSRCVLWLTKRGRRMTCRPLCYSNWSWYRTCFHPA